MDGQYRMKKNIFRLLIICTIGFSSLCGSEAKQLIQSIPKEDCIVLESFFRNLLFFHGFAYTLFGDKPISEEYFEIENPEKPDLYISPNRDQRIWSKYAHLFPSSKYIFLFYENTEEHLDEITLINKKAFHQTFAANKQKFLDYFGPEMTSDRLLDLIIEKQSFWNLDLKRQDLIGILLGYGKVNSELYQKRDELSSHRPRLTKFRTTPSEGYQSVEEELNHLNETLDSFSKEGKISLHYMRLPSFAADAKHLETIQLRQKYSNQRKQITQRYIHGDVLEITLEKLMEPL